MQDKSMFERDVSGEQDRRVLCNLLCILEQSLYVAYVHCIH
jgi:hypothetical protein